MKKKLIASLLVGLLIVGALPIGASAEWRQNADNTWSWLDGDGDPIYYEWKYINGNWYFFDSDGTMKTGWVTDIYTYYMGADGAMKTGWIIDNGKNYYLGADGKLAKDTVVDGIYVNEKGVAQPKEAQKVLLDNKYVKITYLGFNETGYSKELKVQIDNKSNQELILDTDKVAVDGFMVYAIFIPSITAGNSKIDEIAFNDSDITTEFKRIQGKIRILDDKYKELEVDDFSINL